MKKHFKTQYSFDEITKIFTINQLSHVLAEPRHKLISIASESEKFYSPFIDKKGDKERLIDQPIGDLKSVQTKIKDRILNLYPLCEMVHGAVSGRSPFGNAKKHTGKAVVVRLDLQDCFHSIKKEAVYATFRKRFKYSQQVAKLLTKLCTYRGCVPVGSTLSSELVNVVLDPLWRQIEKYCKKNKHEPTVWIDDLIISGENPEKLITEIKRMINGYKLKIGWKKLKIQRNHKEAQEVTGHIVNKILSVPKQKRREYAKTLILAKKDSSLRDKARGQLAFVEFVNPNQGKQLKKLLRTDP